MSTFGNLFKSIGYAISSAIIFNGNFAIAQITPDGTLPSNSVITTQDNTKTIEGGTRAGMNLFHSFDEFSVPKNITVEFKNTADIQNIISRVTGNHISHIDGILRTNGTANLFLINPHGIIFGSHAALDIGGSFVASTASSLNFADGSKFSITDTQTTPLLTVSVPVGLQFGAIANPIRNQSQARLNGDSNAVGLQVQPDKTLALVGGDIILEGGNLTAASGRIELGSVAANSLVSLNPTNQGWILGYENVQNFQNIQLIQRTVDGLNIPSQVDASNSEGNKGNIQVQGDIVELIGFPVRLRTQATGTKNGGDITINARKLSIRDGAAVSTLTRGTGDGGNLTVNASETVELIGAFSLPNTDEVRTSGLLSSTTVAGKAGDIIINTGKLLIQDGAEIATDSVASLRNFQLIPGTGAGGDLIVNASEYIALIGTASNVNVNSGLFASTNTSGDAGQIKITTGQLMIRGGAEISVSSRVGQGYTYPGNTPILGRAGELNVTANSILLDDQGKLSSNSELGQGGDITLQVRDLLLMRRESQISTNAGTSQAPGNGGNITIDAPKGFIVAAPLENSDITANAFSGSGGTITINTNSIFGFVPRTRADLIRLLGTEDPEQLQPSNLPTSDITAFSLQNPSLSGNVEINTPDVDPNKGLVELPINIVNVSQQIATGCHSGGAFKRGSFVVTGRGGIATNPTETLMNDTVLADWIPLEAGGENRTERMQEPMHTAADSVNSPKQIVEAQGWVIDANGNVVLVAQTPTVSHHSPALNSASCAVN
ncbi:MAG: filamentous hemagglutinin N-terminal domain-containing protein [Trichormus sp. ATA11-4-KO1]|jgi:filamentous hemagglutinin family protein|nr:filamentous hemagglutinin N-terminal domain-containing protein [Trichormus sp. ATA11-4-KO1]